MSIYEFQCPNEPCSTPVFDLRLPMADRNKPQRCPECGGAATRNEVPSKAPMVVITSPQEVMGGHTKERMLP